MVFNSSKIPTSMYQLAFLLGKELITNTKSNKPKKIKERAQYILFFTDGSHLYEVPLVCLYGRHITHPYQFETLLEHSETPVMWTLISSEHPLTQRLRQLYQIKHIRNVHEANRIMPLTS